MNQDPWQRSRLLLGEDANEALKQATVAVFGTGGVGSFAAEALARTGVGNLILVDKDVVEPSNINRQLVANLDTIGQVKVDILKDKIARLNPECKVTAIHEFYDQDMNGRLAELKPDYILDCIDSLKSKEDLIRFSLDQNIPIISSMGMARKKDPSRIKVMEIEQTSYDPLAKRLRTWKRKNKIRKKIMVVSSDEKPVDLEQGSALPSMIFVPGSAGLLMAATAVQDLIASVPPVKTDTRSKENPAA